MYRVFQSKLIFVKFQNPFISHVSQLLGKSAAVEVQIVCHLLTVKGNLKGGASCFHRLLGKVGQKPGTDGFGGGAENTVGKHYVFPDGCTQSVFQKFILPGTA